MIVIDADVRERLLESVEAGDKVASRRLLLGKHRSKARLLFAGQRKATFRQFLRHNELVFLTERLGLRDLLLRLKPVRLFYPAVYSAQLNLYMRHRFVAPSLLATIALLGLLRLRPGLAVDAPCGMGHLSYVISRLMPADDLMCLDLMPSFAFATRRFFVPNAAASIAHDLSCPIPLADASVSTMFMSDSIHYIDDKALLVSEIRRVLNETGVAVVSHMHNKLQRNPSAGNPLTPEGYLRLFQDFYVRLLPEDELLRAHLDDAPVDLATPRPISDLEGAPALVAVASKAPLPPSVPAVRTALVAAASAPRVNPLYRLHDDGGLRYFQRRLPQGLADEYPELLDCLPERVEAAAADAADCDGERARLLNARVLLDLPPAY